MVRKRNRNKVLGVDMSLNGTAICFPSGTASVLHLNTNTKNVSKGPDRLFRILEWLQSFDYDGITHVCWEDYAYGTKGQPFSKGELGGIIKLFYLSMGLPIIAPSPATLKKYITGKGNADKSQMQQAVLDRWGYWYEDDNEADAFALCKFGAMWLGEVNKDDISTEINDLLDKTLYYGVTDRMQTFAFIPE